MQGGMLAELSPHHRQGFLLCKTRVITSCVVGMAEQLGPRLRYGLNPTQKSNGFSPCFKSRCPPCLGIRHISTALLARRLLELALVSTSLYPTRNLSCPWIVVPRVGAVHPRPTDSILVPALDPHTSPAGGASHPSTEDDKCSDVPHVLKSVGLLLITLPNKSAGLISSQNLSSSGFNEPFSTEGP